ncbi:MAG: hypothetical protein AB1782_17855 [Cyanobacteriota bacterium]
MSRFSDALLGMPASYMLARCQSQNTITDDDFYFIPIHGMDLFQGVLPAFSSAEHRNG